MHPDLILKIVTDFYKIAIHDQIIGFHFRHIKDFDQHIPRIALFWQLQLNTETEKKVSPPFTIIEKHLPLKFNIGQLNRWVKLFIDVLESHAQNGNISKENFNQWKRKVLSFQKIFRENKLLFP